MTATDPHTADDTPTAGTDHRIAPSVLAARTWRTGPAPGVGRREGRGHITSYGGGRTCSVAGCKTILSKYNDSASCAGHLHADFQATNIR